MNIHLTLKSSNVKTGKIPVSTTSRESCPDVCAFKKTETESNGCYADGFPMVLFWNKVSKGLAGVDNDSFCESIKALPVGQFWRHNQAGDLIGFKGFINKKAVSKLVDANQGKKGFTYTHYDVLKNSHNKGVVKNCNDKGFTVNLSGNNLDHADSLYDLNIAPVVTVLPIDATKNHKTPKGRLVVVCPATQDEVTTCESCKLCQVRDRKVIVGFPAHGNAKKKASQVAERSRA
jgi:hypothetical protein